MDVEIQHMLMRLGHGDANHDAIAKRTREVRARGQLHGCHFGLCLLDQGKTTVAGVADDLPADHADLAFVQADVRRARG
ncbi:hypothetical protein D3C85_1424500 [compost metagenome]